MHQTGIIEQLNYNNIAKIKITRSSSCGENCASCGLCSGRTRIIEAVNDINASVGDTVIINMTDKKILGAAFLVYIVPLIMLITGYCIGDIFFKQELFSIITGFIFMGATFIGIWFIDKKLKQQYTPHIIYIIKSEK